MEYHSLTPISLALEDKAGPGVDRDEDDMEEAKEFAKGTGAVGGEEKSVDKEDVAEIEERKKRKERAKLVEKLKLHSVTRPVLTEKERSLQTVIQQINCSHETRELLKINVEMLNSRRFRRALSVSERVVESATSAWRTTLRMFVETAKFLWPFAKNIFVAIMLFWRSLADLMLRVLEWRAKPDFAALKDISATGLYYPISRSKERF